MFRLYGFFTQNSLKALYVLEESGVEFEFEFVNLAEGEQKTEEFSHKTPVGKVPVLEHDGEYLFESGAICRYVANVTDSPLYPADKMQRARVDQWMDFFTCHLGRWFSTLYFEAVIKPKFNLGEPD
ncbi:MAG: glutathione S-transferase family protein, partial [Proteobacteria bacterium]|nr:glutathione S-transferase family protein [Pseudomonadota bacterium]